MFGQWVGPTVRLYVAEQQNVTLAATEAVACSSEFRFAAFIVIRKIDECGQDPLITAFLLRIVVRLELTAHTIAKQLERFTLFGPASACSGNTAIDCAYDQILVGNSEMHGVPTDARDGRSRGP